MTGRRLPEAPVTTATVNRRGSQKSRGRFLGLMASLPGLGASLLPAGLCPACWPAYAGVLSALGLGFLLKDAWLPPLTAVFLLVAMAVLGYRAQSRHGYGPVVLGTLAASAIVIGKFTLKSDPLTWVGIATFIVASVWNAWPQRPATTSGSPCPMCTSGNQTLPSRQLQTDPRQQEESP